MKKEQLYKNILTFYVGGEKISEVEIHYNSSKSEYSFGRNKGNDIIITSPVVSGRHGVIYVENSKCYVKDLNSTNGVHVNNISIKAKELCDGDNIKIDNMEESNENSVVIVYSRILDNREERWIKFSLEGKDKITIGRAKGIDISLKHPSLSREHASIFKRDNIYFIEDLNSTNGTYLNGEYLGCKTALKENDVIVVGNTKIIFKDNALNYNVISKGLRLDAIHISKVVKDTKGLLRSKSKKILDDITISIKPGELVALIGGSGAGKSTFMDALNGFRLPTEGKVYINNDDFYENYNLYKSVLGYVPQQDIVYDALTIKKMLMYAAELRMPQDTTKEELLERVHQVLEEVELTSRENVLIKQLSGGQKKRVSIAVELIADPKLFFLDEPTSGLDPGMERNMMKLLRKLADNGKTIILITHATANINLCDKAVILGNGGKLCYFGLPEGSLSFFEVEEYADIYDLINFEADKWRGLFLKSQYNAYYKALDNKKFSESKNTGKLNKKNSINGFKQCVIFSRRYLELITKDTGRLAFLLAQPVIIALLLSMVLKSNAFSYYEDAKSVIFTLACAGVWVGVLNSIQEICKERTVYLRERAVNLKLFPYVMSKIIILGVLSFLQSTLLVLFFSVFVKVSGDGLIGNRLIETFITVFLTTFSSMAMGLTISTMVTNTDRAMGIAPIILIPQLVFTGLVFKLDGLSSVIGSLAVSKWAGRAMAVTYGLNDIPTKIQLENPKLPELPKDMPSYYDHNLSNLLNNWYILIAIAFICVGISIILLKRQDTN
ncbi:MAG: FHA domain-containing protein [Clostridium sp.]|uniref:FHA domain-containing protein n=1 Tax=Clostridium sp. TaxID=1506 RepID=UPI003D6CC85F